MQRDSAQDGKQRGVARHLEAELDRLLERDRGEAGDGARRAASSPDAGFFAEPPAHGDDKSADA